MDVRHWIFLGGGEPLVRRSLMMRMLAKMAAYGMTSWIHTNGTLFTPAIIEEIMDRRVSRVIFSIDGPDAAVNDQIRGSGFDKAVANMRHFSVCKQQTGQTAPDLYLNATITNLTWSRLDQFVELAASIGAGTVVFLSGLIVEDEETACLSLLPEQKAALPEMVHKGIQRAEELGIETNFHRFLGGELIEDSTNMQRNVHPAERLGLSGAMCYEPWLSAAIMPDGALGPCCASYDPKALSIRDHSFNQVWHGAYINRVREGMFNGKPPGYCVRCPSNLFADKEEMRIFLTEYLRRDMTPAYKRLAGTLGRAGSTLRAQGLSGLYRRFKEWRKFHAEQ